jgi:ATP-dependent exoDNAse (exonuclease V) alpha subunit
MLLNQGQEAAATAVLQFLLSNEKEFNISGPAGVGKTFMMQHIMSTVLQSYQDACTLLDRPAVDYQIALTATTNKAAEVLSVSTGFPAQTIHSFLKLKVYDDYKTGQSKCEPTKDFGVHTRKLIFVDEASMVDRVLHGYLHKGTDSSCKIIYLGDHCQLAPVMEDLSLVYKQPKPIAHLTEPMRNAGQPALVDLCSRLRNVVETGVFFQLDQVPGVVEYLTQEQAAAFVDSTFRVEDPNSRILCYTNNRVKEYNTYIRQLRGHPDHFSVGEILINNSGLAIGKTFLRVEQELVVQSVDTTIHSVTIDEDDSNTVLHVYTIVAGNTAGSLGITLHVPADPDHFKELMKHYARQKNWSPYYKLKNNYPDLRPRDAATVYKAQGSTYDSVLLDLTDIGKCTQNDQLARMLYVAVSRARSKVYLYGSLPARLFAKAA